MKDWKEKFINKIREGDSLLLMKEIPDESCSLAICDPPYNISRFGNSLTKRGNKIVRADFGSWDKQWGTTEDYFEWFLKWVKEVERILVDKGSFYTFADNHFADHLTYLIERNTGFRQKTPIVIRKINPLPQIMKRNFRNGFERATLFVKDLKKKPRTFNFLTQKSMVNVIDYVIGRKETDHPAEKPLEIIKKFILVSSNAGDVVLDPFSGSGTVAVACKLLERNFIGIDIMDEYCLMGGKRLAGIQVDMENEKEKEMELQKIA